MRPSQEVTDTMVMAQYEEAAKSGLPTDKIISAMHKFAQHCVASGQLPKTIDTAEKAIMTFQMGRELGIPPMKSLYSFYFVNNKLTMYGPTVIERIRLWAKIEYGICNNETATVTITRKDDGTSLSSTVTMKELDERGLTSTAQGKKDTFKKHPGTMLIYKAVGAIVRHIVPEAVGSAAVEGDYGDNADEEKDMTFTRPLSARFAEVREDGSSISMGSLMQPNHEAQNKEGKSQEPAAAEGNTAK